MITILSPTARYRATLSDHDDGTFVAIHAASLGSRDPGRQLGHAILDAPFHVACDHVVDLLADLEVAP
jgi:hypothetical protein